MDGKAYSFISTFVNTAFSSFPLPYRIYANPPQVPRLVSAFAFRFTARSCRVEAFCEDGTAQQASLRFPLNFLGAMAV
jgi:hypothetical protein